MSEQLYIDVPVVTNPDDLSDGALAYIQSKFPGWAPADGNLDTIMVEAFSRMVADARDVASAVPRSIFRYYGNSLLGIAPIADAYASVNTTWTAINTNGYTIPAGTQVGLRAAGDQLIAFQTVFDVVIPPGSLATSAGGVALVAMIAGDQGNLLAGTVELIDPLDWVASIVTVGSTGGGLTAESDDSYLNRLSAELQLLTPRPILPDDFAVLARTIPGVTRAAALDGYNPVGGTFNNERMVAVALVDAAGQPVSGAIKTAVDNLLQGERELNFVVNIIDPSYNNIDVTVNYKVSTGYTISDVDGSVAAAISDYLSPEKWGATEVNSTDWQANNVVRYLEMASVINNVPGVEYIITLTMARNPAALAAADVTLVGVLPLTQPNTIVASGS